MEFSPAPFLLMIFGYFLTLTLLCVCVVIAFFKLGEGAWGQRAKETDTPLWYCTLEIICLVTMKFGIGIF